MLAFSRTRTKRTYAQLLCPPAVPDSDCRRRTYRRPFIPRHSQPPSSDIRTMAQNSSDVGLKWSDFRKISSANPELFCVGDRCTNLQRDFRSLYGRQRRPRSPSGPACPFRRRSTRPARTLAIQGDIGGSRRPGTAQPRTGAVNPPSNSSAAITVCVKSAGRVSQPRMTLSTSLTIRRNHDTAQL